jgi:hypothetical protein
MSSRTFVKSQNLFLICFFNVISLKNFDKKLFKDPLGRMLQMSSIVDYWHACLNLSLLDTIFWNTLLSAAIWVIWIEWNKKIFQGLGDQLLLLYIWKFFLCLSFGQDFQLIWNISDVLALEGAVLIHGAVVGHEESRENSSSEDIVLLDTWYII